MDIHDLQNIIDEISNLKNQEIVLSDKLDNEKCYRSMKLLMSTQEKVVVSYLDVLNL